MIIKTVGYGHIVGCVFHPRKQITLLALQGQRKGVVEAVEKLQEAERLRRWAEIAQSENIARLLGAQPSDQGLPSFLPTFQSYISLPLGIDRNLF